MARFLHPFGVESSVAYIQSLAGQEGEVEEAVNSVNPDVIITFGDEHAFFLGESLGVPVISWFLWGADEPIVGYLDLPNVTIACATRGAQSKCEEIGVGARYVPHAFDPYTFRPGRRASARARLGWEDDYPTVVSVGTNSLPLPDRKNWAGVLESFKLASEGIQGLRLHAHTSADGALDIPAYAKELGIEDSVEVAGLDESDRGFPPGYVADLYRASDVLLMPSLAEGFGVPLIEAQACGTPVITTGTHPMDELVFFGHAVPSTPHPDRKGWAQPDVGALAIAMNYWIGHGKYRGADEYSAEAVVEEHLLPVLKEVTS